MRPAAPGSGRGLHRRSSHGAPPAISVASCAPVSACRRRPPRPPARGSALESRRVAWPHPQRSTLSAVSLPHDLDRVAVRDHVVAADALTVEPRRRAPHGATTARRGQLVVDRVGHVHDRRARVKRDRLGVDSPACRRKTRISPVRPQTASRNASRLASSSTETPSTGRPGHAAASRSRSPGAASSSFVAASSAGFSIPAAATSLQDGAQLGRVAARCLAEDDRVGVAQHAEERLSTSTTIRRAFDQTRDLDELHEHAADARQRRDRP